MRAIAIPAIVALAPKFMSEHVEHDLRAGRQVAQGAHHHAIVMLRIPGSPHRRVRVPVGRVHEEPRKGVAACAAVHLAKAVP